MPNKKMDLTKHMPSHPFMKAVAVVFALVGLTGLWGSLTHADLQIQSAIDNVVSTFKELRITTDGSPQGDVKVILGTGGIRVATGALGGPIEGVLKTHPNGYVYRALISGSDIAPDSITTDHIVDGTITIDDLSVDITQGGGGSSNLNCPAGEAVIEVVNGNAVCAPIIGVGECGTDEMVIGWSNTGLLLCGDIGDTVTPGGGLWHQSTVNPFDIFYGTQIDDDNGNVAVGHDTPEAKLHVNGTFRVDMSGSINLPYTGLGGGHQYVLDSIKGYYPSRCNTGVNCINSSIFNPQYPSAQLRGIEIMGSYVNSYVIGYDPYNWDFDTTYPRCTCDTTTTDIDCSPSHVSNMTDPYCVDIDDNSGPAEYYQGLVVTKKPVNFYKYNGPAPAQSSTIDGGHFIANAARVGVNTLLPGAALEVIGDIRFSSYAGTGIRNLGVDGNGDLVLMPNLMQTFVALWQEGMNGDLFYNGGDVGIGTSNPGAKLHVNGDILTSQFYIASDEQLKTNIMPISDALFKLEQLNGYSFTWILGGKNDIGLLAQEVELVFPEIVKTTEDGLKAVEYANLIALVIQAMKELNARTMSIAGQYNNNATITQLYSQYQTNASTISSLEARLTALENAMAQ